MGICLVHNKNLLTSDSQRISYRQEHRYRYPIIVLVPEKEFGGDVQTVAGDAFHLLCSVSRFS